MIQADRELYRYAVLEFFRNLIIAQRPKMSSQEVVGFLLRLTDDQLDTFAWSIFSLIDPQKIELRDPKEIAAFQELNGKLLKLVEKRKKREMAANSRELTRKAKLLKKKER